MKEFKPVRQPYSRQMPMPHRTPPIHHGGYTISVDSRMETARIERGFPRDNDWQLTVTFDDNDQFIWDSKRKTSDGQEIDESIKGTHSIERGFLISYKFDKPTNQALEQIPRIIRFLAK